MKKNYLHNPASLKIDLMLHGVRVEDSVVKAWACGSAGIDLMLPHKTIVNIPCKEEFTNNSPYVIKKGIDGGYIIAQGNDWVKVELLERPGFFNKKTASGVFFSKIAKVHGSYTVITPYPRCDFFNKNIECKYCAGDFNITGQQESSAFSVEDVLETVEAVLKESPTKIIYLSIGFSDGDGGGVEFLEPYIKAIKKNFSCLVAVEALPPKQNKWIDDTYALGADSVLYNIEIYDKELFELICPGRAELIGRKRYLDALKYAAGIFPNGTVASHLIVGLEPPGSTIIGIDALTEMGVVPILPIYRPSSNRALRIEPLDTEIIIPVYKHLYKALKKAKINFNWVRDLSMVTTPIEGKLLLDGGANSSGNSLVENFYKTKLGYKTALGLSSIRRKLRVKSKQDTE